MLPGKDRNASDCSPEHSTSGLFSRDFLDVQCNFGSSISVGKCNQMFGGSISDQGLISREEIFAQSSLTINGWLRDFLWAQGIPAVVVIELIESIVWAHNKFKVAPATQPRASRIIQGTSFVGVTHYLRVELAQHGRSS
ncbi:hypothetical protein OIU79_020345 [Salix purpurea]|uniref:Uncharacterized protein n=1 Tax=Salix purpurea TaxID=77065 RepID=A0A9Q0SGC6_SALPP|nr:hypothetical protein OIU79_020345 [Salix purpurea]